MKAQTLGDTASLEFMRGRRILEINPDHPIVKDLCVSAFGTPPLSSRCVLENKCHLDGKQMPLCFAQGKFAIDLSLPFQHIL